MSEKQADWADEMAWRIVKAVADERERCAKTLEGITQLRDHEVFRGLDPAEGTDGWRPLTASEKRLLKTCAARIRGGE